MRVFVGLLMVSGGPLVASASVASACQPEGVGDPVFESCETWKSPFESRVDWLEFMAEGASASEVAALAESWSEEEFEGWRSGQRGSIEKVTLRSESLLLRGLLVRPRGAGPFPAGVYARGGNREWGRLRFLDVIRMLMMAESGRVVLAVEYRGEGGSEGKPELGAGDVVDVRTAAAALAALPFVDSEQLDVVGFSRGGLTAAWALEPPTLFRSAVLIAADLDLSDTASRRPQMDSEIYRLSVTDYAKDREAALFSRSPVNAVHRLADVPLLLLHAADDVRVHPSASLEFAASWTEAGRRARIVLFESGGHALLSHSPAVRAELESWLGRDVSPLSEIAASSSSSSSSESSSAESITAARGELLIPRYGPSAATDGRWVYVYGGAPSGSRNGPDFMHQGLLSTIERVDPTTLESEYFSNGLHRRANHASVGTAESLVSCGGRTQVGLSRFRVASCEILDLETGIFRELPDLPEAVRTLGLVDVDGYFYAVGGFTAEGGYSNGTWKLEPGKAAWEPLEEMPFSREGGIVSVGRRIYAIGGYNGEAMRSVLMFDTESETWERLEDLPYPLSAFSAVSDSTAIYLFGDYERTGSVHRLDPVTGSLDLLDVEITPRRHSDAVIVDGRVLVIGGNQQSQGLATRVIEAFELEDLRRAGVRN
ncbi:MAG: prolyl oligopeptidase family serine peptidase [Acidobacteriota bacterium]